MTLVKNYIGIDISKRWLDIAVLRPAIRGNVIEMRCSNNLSGLQKLKTALSKKMILLNKASLITCEHSGIYKKNLVDFAMKQHCLLCIVAALRIKKSLGIQRGKNDRIDAKRIAQYAFLHRDRLTYWRNPRKIIIKLKDLLINRDRLHHSAMRLEAALKEFKEFLSLRAQMQLRNLNSHAISGIKKSLELLDIEMQWMVDNDKQLRKQVDLLTSVPGIGILLALNLICFTNEFLACETGRQLACYLGLAPFEFSSGSSVRGRSKVNPIANKRLKAMLHMPALSLLNCKGEISKYYKRRIAEGKSKMSVINAVKNKIILRAVAVIKRGTPYVSSHKIVKCQKSLALVPRYKQRRKSEMI